MDSNPLVTYQGPLDVSIAEAELSKLAGHINSIYLNAEAIYWGPGYERINSDKLRAYIQNNELIIARSEGQVIGCIHVCLFDRFAVFGMLTVLPQYRRKRVAAQLVELVEKWAMENGKEIVRLELLTPTEQVDPEKEMLRSWYERIGYQKATRVSIEGKYPQLVDKLKINADFTLYRKKLV